MAKFPMRCLQNTFTPCREFEVSITTKKDQLLKSLEGFKNKDERLQYIIDLGKNKPALEDAKKDDKFLVKGCMSQAWLIPQFENGKLHFDFDSEALIVKGIMALLMEVYNDNTPSENLQVHPDFLAPAGITEHLSMNRRNGLANLFKQIHLYSATFHALQNRG